MLFVYLVLVVALMAAVATVFTRTTVYLMGKYAGESINRIHRDTEAIITTHKVPEHWKTPWEDRLRTFDAQSAGDASRDRIERSAHRQSLKRIRTLIRHFERTSMIADEEARDLVLQELRSVYAHWQSSDWEHITG